MAHNSHMHKIIKQHKIEIFTNKIEFLINKKEMLTKPKSHGKYSWQIGTAKTQGKNMRWKIINVCIPFIVLIITVVLVQIYSDLSIQNKNLDHLREIENR